MGTWGVGTFENDGSYSFWEAFEENPLEEIVRIAKKYADMDTEDMDLDVEDAIEIQISALLTAGFIDSRNIHRLEPRLATELSDKY
ncbi:hypothetical protein CAAN4_F08966 [[Candida] anglica]|uniref:DUF4259 domain-containing protein n=1 Tax=[Candida] anglica TaxID=148631 RepID=A0ABP0EF87_9ASCO